MVRGIVVLSGNSHPRLAESICQILGIPPGQRILDKFSSGESRCEIQASVRGKDVFIIQSGSGEWDSGVANDHLIDLCIMISACKTGSAKRVTAITPLFPYSRQPDLPYNKAGAPLSLPTVQVSNDNYTFESVPTTPAPGVPKTIGLSPNSDLHKMMNKPSGSHRGPHPGSRSGSGERGAVGHRKVSPSPSTGVFTTHDYVDPYLVTSFVAKPGYKRWVAQSGNLVADLLTCAGADHVVAMDLHDAQYQGFFEQPFDNLYGRPLLQRYIKQNVPNYQDAVIVSPDAGGAKRATAIADSLGMEFALIHKERRPTKVMDRQNATMILVGSVANRVCILIDDLADTANTITRAANLLRREGATRVYALLSHGVFSGDSLRRINASSVDKIVVTNSVAQEENKAACPKLEVLDVAPIFAEAIRRIHHGESISSLFQYD